MAKTYGVITGKFAPLHSGHIYAITKAATEVDLLYVILSFDNKFIEGMPSKMKRAMSLKKRLLWLKTTFKDLPHIKVVHVDESEIKPYPDGAEEWTHLVKSVLKSNGVDKISKWFSSEHEYSWWVNKYFPEATHVVLDSDRKVVNVSATQIRANPFDYWQYMPSVVRKEFLLKVCIIGEESSAKTSLTKYLSKLFNTSWVEEYGRLYCEQDMCGDESLLSIEDYALIASNRYYHEIEAEKTANKILFVDTNAFVTQYYCKLYEGKFNPLVDAYIEQETYDVILHLSNEVKWVSDGLRINNDRELTSKVFNEMLDMYGVKGNNNYHYVEGDYKQRLDKAVSIISDLLNNKGE